MKTLLTLGGVVFCLESERYLRAAPEVAPFILQCETASDVSVRVKWDWLQSRHPVTPPVGRDLIQIYYDERDCRFCELDGGDRGALSCVRYTPDFREMLCSVNDVSCPVDQAQVSSVMRMLPVRAVFLHFGALFLHASQILIKGRGILFSAPSGTGKTTQARLWRDLRGAEIVCNDRTIVRKRGGVWHTYGYPLDGSEPVGSGEVNRLGCIVMLRQGRTNEITRLRPRQAAAMLMEQVVLDTWDFTAKNVALTLILELLEHIPVYLLVCTKDERAVEALETKIYEEIEWDGTDF